jgi:hypothetical protein
MAKHTAEPTALLPLPMPPTSACRPVGEMTVTLVKMLVGSNSRSSMKLMTVLPPPTTTSLVFTGLRGRFRRLQVRTLRVLPLKCAGALVVGMRGSFRGRMGIMAVLTMAGMSSSGCVLKKSAFFWYCRITCWIEARSSVCGG